jgi:hypothetical protein
MDENNIIKYCLLRVGSALMKLDNPQSYLISTSEPQLILYVLYTDTHHKGLNEANQSCDYTVIISKLFKSSL